MMLHHLPILTILLCTPVTALMAKADDSVGTESVPSGHGKTPPQIKVTPTRGQLLYENHCLGCHESQAYIRQNRKARNLAGIRYFVIIRATDQKLDWDETEIQAVTDYLNQRFYKFTE